MFLVSDNAETTRKVVFTAARLLAGNDVAQGLKKKRIIDLSEVSGTSTKSKTAPNTVENLLLKAAGMNEIILFLPAAGSKTQKLFGWTEILKTFAARGKVQFLARLPSSLCDAVEKDLGWRRTTHTINIPDANAGEIPGEL